MKNKNILRSFKNAINGIIQTTGSERNMKIHITATVLVLLLSFLYKLTRIELLIVFFTIALVLICELFNTTIEMLIDLITEVYHPKAKIIKDTAAGAVLISAILSLIVAYVIFFDRILNTIKYIFK